MKRCIVISDSFKGSLSSSEICRIAKKSIARFFSEQNLETPGFFSCEVRKNAL